MKCNSPPRFAGMIFKILLDDEAYRERTGDIEEIYLSICRERGAPLAKVWLLREVIKAIPTFIRESLHWRFLMFQNYLKIIFRILKKHKGYSFINISGLAISMACCILILLWIQDELSFDRFHENADRICRVVSEVKQSDGDTRQSATTSWPLGEALVEDYPEIKSYTRFYNLSRKLITFQSETGDRSFYENGVCVADPSFLDIFSFPLVKGDPATALAEPNTVVITEKITKKYFGNENPLGKKLTSNNRTDLVVTGVIKVPHNSHIRFDFLLPFEPTLRNTPWNGSWWISDFHTFILLEENVIDEDLEDKIYPYIQERFPESVTKLKLQALTDIHLRSDYNYDLYGASKDTSVYIYAFSIIAVFILFIACINFLNLTIAMASTRAREAGLRKVVGAGRKNVIAQFFGESVFLTLISFIFALTLIYLLLPFFNNLTEKTLTLNPFGNIMQGLSMLLIAILTGILAGLYPAVIQSSFQPINIIKSDFVFGAGKGKGAFRKALVLFQFTCSIVLIIGTLIINKQFIYIQNKNLGYEKDHIIYFTQRGEIGDKYDAFKEELLQNPNVSSVTTSSDVPTQTHHSTMKSFEWEGMDPGANQFQLYQFSVDPDYLETFAIELLDGRDFSKEFGTDRAGAAYILNEAAVKVMDLKNPVGKWFTFWGNKGTIIGVVKDYHYKSLHSEVEPLVLRIDPEWDRYIFVKINSSNVNRTLNSIKDLHQRFNPQFPLEYHFLDEQLGHLYESDHRTFILFQYFTVIALLISCLGLFGLVAYMAQRRTKEIGIRKVVGATIANIALMLSKEFLVLVVAANILAWPIAYFAMHRWLQNFAYRASLSIWIFFFSGLSALVIALLTVSYQTIKAATATPVNSLRHE